MADLDQTGVAIIGAGPAGLMAAETIARAGVPVTIYERMPSPGRKFLMAGRGGLNLTHSEPLDAFLGRYGAAADRLRPVLDGFSPAALAAWAEGLGEPTFVGTSGRVFPKSFKASPLLRAWLRRLADLGVRLVARARWTGFAPDGGLTVETPDGVSVIHPQATVLALGGASWPRLGADGGWVPILAAAGVPVTPLAPANCGVAVAWSEVFRERSAGEPLKRIALTVEGETVRGEAMVTATGLEGGAVYALAGRLRDAIARTGGPVEITVDLRPGVGADEIAAGIARARKADSLSNRLRKGAGLAPVAVGLLREGHGRDLPADPAALAAAIKSVPLWVTGVAGLERAISTAGGVSLDAVGPDFELAALPGVFVAGEMLDWEAPTGGYLLQASMATGVAAGRGVLRRLGR